MEILGKRSSKNKLKISMVNKIDLDLRGRFVKDYNLPIQVLVSPYFEYFLDLYQEDYGSKSKWDKLQKEIETRFEGKPGKYLDHFYITRNKIIEDIEKSENYKHFCEDKEFFTRFSIPGEIKCDLYTGEQVNKFFLSIDLKKANFQAVRFYDPGLVFGAKTYKEFISLYDNSDLLAESKYTRQVIFGKLNAKRQITLEKYLMYRISEEINSILPKDFIIFSRQTDEIIYELPKDYLPGEIEEQIVSVAKERLGLEVKVEVFTMTMLQRFTKEGSSVVGLSKNYLYPINKKSTLHKVPGVHFPQMYKMWKGKEIDPTYDLVLLHEGQLAHFDYPLFLYNNAEKV